MKLLAVDALDNIAFPSFLACFILFKYSLKDETVSISNLFLIKQIGN